MTNDDQLYFMVQWKLIQLKEHHLHDKLKISVKLMRKAETNSNLHFAQIYIHLCNQCEIFVTKQLPEMCYLNISVTFHIVIPVGYAKIVIGVHELSYLDHKCFYFPQFELYVRRVFYSGRFCGFSEQLIKILHFHDTFKKYNYRVLIEFCTWGKKLIT